MSSNKFRGRIKGAILTLSLLFGVGLAASAAANAQYRNGDRYGYGYDIYRIAQDQGYRDGVEHGQEHAREGHRYDPQGTRHYKDATAGYRSEYGNKDAYKQAYRQGFQRGYDEGFRQDGNYGGYDRGRDSSSNDPYYRNDDPYYRNDRNGGYGGYGGNGQNDIYRIAQDQGYRDGVDHGAEHARDNHRYDPEGTRHYKDATEGYRSEYGNKDAYKQAYREGFRRGYDEGFNRGYNRGGYSRRNQNTRRAADILGTIFGRP